MRRLKTTIIGRSRKPWKELEEEEALEEEEDEEMERKEGDEDEKE